MPPHRVLPRNNPRAAPFLHFRYGARTHTQPTVLETILPLTSGPARVSTVRLIDAWSPDVGLQTTGVTATRRPSTQTQGQPSVVTTLAAWSPDVGLQTTRVIATRRSTRLAGQAPGPARQPAAVAPLEPNPPPQGANARHPKTRFGTNRNRPPQLRLYVSCFGLRTLTVGLLIICVTTWLIFNRHICLITGIYRNSFKERLHV